VPLCERSDVTLALSSWWMVGWVTAAVVIALVAILLLAITGLARKVDGTAGALIKDLDSIATKTRPLQSVGATVIAVQTITRCLRLARGAAPAKDRYSTSPGWRP
jgi:hypothetical protein